MDLPGKPGAETDQGLALIVERRDVSHQQALGIAHSSFQFLHSGHCVAATSAVDKHANQDHSNTVIRKGAEPST